MGDRSPRFFFRPDDDMNEDDVIELVAVWIESLDMKEARVLAAALREEVGHG